MTGKSDNTGLFGKLIVCLAMMLLSITGTSAFGQQFPVLTGRVVDLADLLSEQQEESLVQTLATHENQTSNQIVVATIADLDGYAVADYANRLGRYWEIGTAAKNNGVLLVVAPNERKVRIEVGYGLEGALTDALSSIIIQREILPAFRRNDYPAGIDSGVNAILQAIAGEYTAQQGEQESNDALSNSAEKFLPLIFIAMVAVPEFLRRRGLRKAADGAFPAGFAGLMLTLATGNLWLGIAAAIAVFLFVFFKGSGAGKTAGQRRRGGNIGSGGFGHGTGSGGFGGGFSGRGGSFGGGGASGSW